MNPSDQTPITPQQTPYNSNQEKLKSKFFSKGIKNISGTLGLLIAAPILALLITAHVFQPYQVDGASMETTLQNGDRLIVLKIQKTLSNLTGSDYIPKRGEVIIFDKPRKLTAPESTKHLIKRVIGLPGERVVVKDGTVTVFNKDNPEGFDPDANKEYTEGFVATSGNVDITVGAKEVFVLGDNRGNSSDSRIFGSIPVDIIVGRATARFIPVNSMKKL